MLCHLRTVSHLSPKTLMPKLTSQASSPDCDSLNNNLACLYTLAHRIYIRSTYQYDRCCTNKLRQPQNILHRYQSILHRQSQPPNMPLFNFHWFPTMLEQSSRLTIMRWIMRNSDLGEALLGTGTSRDESKNITGSLPNNPDMEIYHLKKRVRELERLLKDQGGPHAQHASSNTHDATQTTISSSTTANATAECTASQKKGTGFVEVMDAIAGFVVGGVLIIGAISGLCMLWILTIVPLSPWIMVLGPIFETLDNWGLLFRR